MQVNRKKPARQYGLLNQRTTDDQALLLGYPGGKRIAVFLL